MYKKKIIILLVVIGVLFLLLILFQYNDAFGEFVDDHIVWPYFYGPPNVFSLPSGYVLLDEMIASSEKISYWTFWNREVVVFLDSEVAMVYQIFIRENNFMVKYKGEYYINESKHIELLNTFGFVSLDEKMPYLRDRLSYGFFEDQILFFDLKGRLRCKSSINDTSFIIKYNGTYYFHEHTLYVCLYE